MHLYACRHQICTCTCACTCACIKYLYCRGRKGAGSKGRSKEKSKKLLQRERDRAKCREGSNQDPDGLSVVKPHAGEDEENPFLGQHDKKLLLRERDQAKGREDSNQDPDGLGVVKAHARGDDEKIDQPSSDPLPQVKRGVRKRSSEVMICMIESHLGRREPRVGMPEPPHPSSPGLHTRVVNTIDGSVSWVKVSSKVPVSFKIHPIRICPLANQCDC